ncbi:hypothetical protein RPHASCH2410_CH16965 [Rhizobium phaseoli Ch24-10]|nr:hypothetical protein RPHASCH2410_CH16965 [Rhizobium phaseoli Ch24-10]
MLHHAAEQPPDGDRHGNATGEILYKECIGKSGESRAKGRKIDFSCGIRNRDRIGHASAFTRPVRLAQ